MRRTEKKIFDFFFNHLDKHIFVNKCGFAIGVQLAFGGILWFLSPRFGFRTSYQLDMILYRRTMARSSDH